MKIKVKWYQLFYLAFLCACFSAPFYSAGVFFGVVYSILMFIVASLVWVSGANYGHDYFLNEFKKEIEEVMRIQERAERNFEESQSLLRRTRHE